MYVHELPALTMPGLFKKNNGLGHFHLFIVLYSCSMFFFSIRCITLLVIDLCTVNYVMECIEKMIFYDNPSHQVQQEYRAVQ